MNWNFFAHVIRDVFVKPITPLIYTNDLACLDALRGIEHSLGFEVLYSRPSPLGHEPFMRRWSTTEALFGYGPGYCDLFVYVGGEGDSMTNRVEPEPKAVRALVSKGGFILLIDPGPWSKSFAPLKVRDDLTAEVKRYSFLKNRKVLIYENL